MRAPCSCYGGAGGACRQNACCGCRWCWISAVSLPVRQRQRCGEEERRRVVPAIAALRKAYPDAVISIDTYRADTAEAAIAAGADIINDISAMEADPRMADVVVATKAPIILMHMRGTPKNMQQNCEYKDVVQEVAVYLAQRAQLLRERGVSADKIILDPGICFAKNVEQNLLLMRDLKALTSFGYPVLLAASRKSTLGAVLGGVPAEQRLEGTIATSLQAIYAGAQMVRVHDVEENVRAIQHNGSYFARQCGVISLK